MKLFEIQKPIPIRLLTEGYNFVQDADGHFVLDYDSSTPGQNDEIMVKRMSGLKSKKVGNRIKIETPRSVQTGNFNVFSRKEQDEFQPHYNKDTFQTSVPTFYGMSLDPGGRRSSEREQYNRILDALKERHGHYTTPEAMDHMLHQAAKSAVKQMKEYYRAIERADNIIIIPVPSSSELPKKFAEALSQELGSHGKATSIHDILEQNRNYKMGVAGGKNMDPDKLVDLYQNVIGEYQRGRRSEEQVLQFIDNAQAFLDKKISDPKTSDQDLKLYQADLAFLQRAEEQFYDIVGQPVGGGEDGQLRVHDLFGGIRRHVYDRVKIKKGAKAPKRTDNTIYILADDNVDQGRTIIDVYRYLYKNGLFNQPGTKVIGAVMHKLGADIKR